MSTPEASHSEPSQHAPITVVARWQASAGARATVLGLVGELRQRSLGEAGCLGYEVFQSADDDDVIFLLERYRDVAALEAHRGSSHYRELLAARILPLLATRRVELLRATSAAELASSAPGSPAEPASARREA